MRSEELPRRHHVPFLGSPAWQQSGTAAPTTTKMSLVMSSWSSATCPFFATSALSWQAIARAPYAADTTPVYTESFIGRVPLTPSAWTNAMKDSAAAVDILCGSVAGITSKLIEHPFDTIKVRLQSQRIEGSKGLLYKGTWDCIQRSINDEHGLRNLYRGLASPLVGAVGENAILFLTYGVAQSALRNTVDHNLSEAQPLPVSHLAMAGAFAGGCVSFLLTPVELIKCQMQVNNNNNGSAASSWQLFRRIVRQQGWQGMYRGYSGTFLREFFGGAAWFGVYETVSRHLTQGETSTTTRTALLAGAAAGIAYNTALFPADVIKSLQQTQKANLSFNAVARQLWQAEGYRGFYRGFGITLARAGPSSAMIFYTYEMLKNMMQ